MPTLPTVHLLTAPQVAFAPFTVHAAPVFVPLVQAPGVLHWALAVQAAPTVPAVHLLIAPQVALAPAPVQAVPVFGPSGARARRVALRAGRAGGRIGQTGAALVDRPAERV